MSIRSLSLMLVVLSVLAGCNDGPELDTPTSGTIKISVDEAFRPFMDSEVTVFHALYTNANVRASYLSETDAMQSFVNDKDSVRLAIVSRQLNDNEKKYFEQIKITPHSTKIAIDAVALIVNPENKDTALTMQQVSDLFTGKIQTWKDIDPKSGQSELRVVFDSKGSSTARYVKEKFGVKELPATCSAVNTNAEVVNYVATHKQAIGVIGVAWISDDSDSTQRDFLKKIQVMRIITDSTAPRGIQPYQAYIAKGMYPLTRNIYILSREARGGLGTGFAAFVAGDKGQLIILKSGVMPATQPVRIIGFH